MNNKIWVYKKIDNQISSDLKTRYGFSLLCANVLQNRMNIAGDSIDNIFKRVLYNLHNPYLLNDMDCAVARIDVALMRNEKITIYGDYDADGVTSTSILYMFLKESGADVDYYIPNRFSDGYGMNKDKIKSMSDNGTKLIITVDNGIAAYDEIEYAKSLGLDVIVTDHHECPEVLPDCIAVINPKRKDSTYPFANLAGVGVVFKLICALNKSTLESVVKKYILLTALGTVADVMPLVDENRAIVTMGLKMVPVNKNKGLKHLFDVSGIEDVASISDFTFSIIPRINASGRLHNADVCVKLFSSNDDAECLEISNDLNELNASRQAIEKDITEHSFSIIEDKKLYKDNVIVVYNEGWNHGVIGIVASKITEKYYKPCIVLTDSDDFVKGSGRSVSGFDLYESLKYCKDCLLKYGGHSLAAGLSLETENIEAFRKLINEYANEFLNGESFSQKIYIDDVLNEKCFTIPVVESLRILEPYGIGNPRPVFAVLNAIVRQKQTLSEGKHIKLNLECNGELFEAIGFSMGEYDAVMNIGDTIDVAGNLDINTYRGFSKTQFIIKDIKRIRRS